ncbi:fatty acid synthase alpha subunit Lsd1, partial [Linderina pennispora]
MADYAVERPLEEGYFGKSNTTHPTGNHIIKFPKVKSYQQLENMHYLQNMVNLDKVVVVTGFGEVGPFGSASLRWEMEAYGEFSLEGCIELAWIMGLIKRVEQTKPLIGETYIGWADAKTGEPVRDMDIKPRYEEYILQHTGIRVIEPEIHEGFEPDKKPLLCELQIDHDMNPFETSAEEAISFKRGNGDKVDTWENTDGTWSVRFLKGAVLLIPKAVRFDRHVASQLPTGWDPVRYGIPKDIADTVDPITCYGIVAATEALVKSGITDPYELFQYFHVSEV